MSDQSKNVEKLNESLNSEREEQSKIKSAEEKAKERFPDIVFPSATFDADINELQAQQEERRYIFVEGAKYASQFKLLSVPIQQDKIKIPIKVVTGFFKDELAEIKTKTTDGYLTAYDKRSGYINWIDLKGIPQPVVHINTVEFTSLSVPVLPENKNVGWVINNIQSPKFTDWYYCENSLGEKAMYLFADGHWQIPKGKHPVVKWLNEGKFEAVLPITNEDIEKEADRQYPYSNFERWADERKAFISGAKYILKKGEY